MNVEIGAEAAQFPEKEYITELPWQCRAAEAKNRDDPSLLLLFSILSAKA